MDNLIWNVYIGCRRERTWFLVSTIGDNDRRRQESYEIVSPVGRHEQLFKCVPS